MNTTSGLMYVLSTILAFFSYNIAADASVANQGVLVIETIVYAPAMAQVIPFARSSARARVANQSIAA
jgi:hypothetical protein